MQYARLLDSPSGELLRGLFTVRENAFLLFMLRRDLRNGRALIALTAYLAGLAVCAVGGLALGIYVPASAAGLFPANGAAGTLASALVTTVQFWVVLAIARRSRFAVSSALERQALADYALLPLSPAYRSGLQRTYPALLTLGLSLLALPVHVAAALGGGGGLSQLIATQAFLLACTVAWVDEPALVTQWEKRKGETTPAQSRKRQRAIWINLAVNGPNLAFQLLRTRLGPGAVAWVLFFPYMVPAWLLAPRPAWWWFVPPALLLVMALPFSIACSERLAARTIQGRPETIRVYPWSFGLTGTLIGLTLVLGFLWPSIRSGWPARALALAANDPTRSAEGVLAVLLAFWCFRAVLRLARSDSGPSYGPLPSPSAFIGPLAPARARRYEIGWALEAAGSVYVPIGALLLAWIVGGDMPWPDPLAGLELAAGAASILLALWGLGRLGVWCQARGAIRAYRWLLGGLSMLTIAGIATPPPYGRWVLALSPYGASAGLVPWIGHWFSSRFPIPAGDFPTPGTFLPFQLALGVVGVVYGIRSWDLLRATLPGAAAGHLPGAPVPSVAVHYEKVTFLERLTANPIGIRLFRARNAVAPEVVFGLSLGGAILVYTVWGWSALWCAVAPRPSAVADFLARQPWVLALPLAFAVGVSLLAATLQAGTAVRIERMLGAFGLTCLTPLSDREMLEGYLLRPRLTAQLAVVGPALVLPLVWLNTPTLPVTLIVATIALVSVPFGIAVTRLSVAEALPVPPITVGRGIGELVALIAASVFLVLEGIAVVVCVPLLMLPGATRNWGAASVAAIALVLAITVAIALWADARLRKRFAAVRKLAIPQGPDEKMAEYLAAQGVRSR